MSRHEAYAWLAEKLQIDSNKCHIGMFDENQCLAVINVCKERKNDHADCRSIEV